MLRRLIENWWTNTTERTFQQPFAALCQVRGETVLHVTRHCGMELGKDVITRSADGTIHTYQLKTCKGKRLTLSQWQSELSGQLADLIESPVTHASIGTIVNHQPWIVINGDLDEEVTRAISDRNITYAKQFGRVFKVRVIGELVEESIRDSTSIWPQNPQTVKTLFECSLSSGRANLDKLKIAQLLNYILSLPEDVSKAEVVRSATFLPLLASLATMQHSNEGNWHALIEAWVMCKSYVRAIACKYNVELTAVRTTLDLLDQLIDRNLESLQEEVSKNTTLLATIFDYPFELVRARSTIVLGYLSLLGLKRIPKSESSDPLRALIDELLRNKKLFPLLWGESAVPFCIAIYFFLRMHRADQSSDAFLIDLVRNLAIENSLSAKRQFPQAYVGINEIFERQFLKTAQVAAETPQESCGLSMWLGPSVDLLARTGYRQALSSLWNEITDVEKLEFRPKHDWQFFQWRSEEGATVNEPFNAPQSWRELQQEIEEMKENSIESDMLKDPVDSLLFLLVFPHRVNRRLMRGIDRGIDGLDRNNFC